MRRLLGPRGQIALVVLLFAGSLAVLLYSVFAGLGLPGQELRVRDQLMEAGRRLSEAAAVLRREEIASSQDWNERLRGVTARVLADYAGVEGGFTDGAGWFGGYAYPTSPHRGSDVVARNEPPPLETPVIQQAAEKCLDDGKVIVQTLDVESSRVVVLAQPVGKRWPSRLAVWLLYRLTGPEQMAGKKGEARFEVESLTNLTSGRAVDLAPADGPPADRERRVRDLERELDRIRGELERLRSGK